MACVFRIKSALKSLVTPPTPNSGLGISISSDLDGPPRSSGETEVRGRRGEAAVINRALPLGCRGCGCRLKLDGKQAAIFSLRGGGGAPAQRSRERCHMCSFSITIYGLVRKQALYRKLAHSHEELM